MQSISGYNPLSAFHAVRLTRTSENEYVINSESEKDQFKTETKAKSYQVEMLKAKRNSKNRDAAQQAFLIGMAASFGYQIDINKLYKKGKTTSQLFTINSISKDNKFLFKTHDVVPEVEDLRDKRRCLDAVTNSTLLDIIIATIGVKVCEKKCRISKYGNSIGMRRIKALRFGGCNFSTKEITEFGNRIHNNILNHMGTKSCIIDDSCNDITAFFRQNNESVSSIVH
ncbi:hypothetical protein EIN_390610 [Entamoeba invadens IP1]|uniref:Uncharacterized protein n=1 Tax=Entamoeba invadens IP1 TaxID=370355 RepID=A0A0A1UB60_ENTIV|nr:hypothetical protein EIN_390610 [Entamoeba invadens IP1]ELP89436.1 hypothetical protein EIN_390610 [Entamoeba invadens IP1]|eukprot:XP_004256207.1 hypothetical protein EIN_390610 [Entamoeba invadens IP1]